MSVGVATHVGVEVAEAEVGARRATWIACSAWSKRSWAAAYLAWSSSVRAPAS
jgi:hypothetical protein